MTYCYPRGIPHSTFLGSVHPGVWTDEDRAKALAFGRAEGETCPQCGTRDVDWIDPETNIGYMPPLWEPTVRTCIGCQETARLRDALIKAKQNMDGVRVIVVPFDSGRPNPVGPEAAPENPVVAPVVM